MTGAHAPRDALRAATALQNVKLELQANQEILTRIHENNVQTIETAQAAAGEDSESERESRPFIPGVQVRDTAWQALLDTGVSSYIDYELLLSLSETYSMQAIYKETGMHLVNASMTMAASFLMSFSFRVCSILSRIKTAL